MLLLASEITDEIHAQDGCETEQNVHVYGGQQGGGVGQERRRHRVGVEVCPLSLKSIPDISRTSHPSFFCALPTVFDMIGKTSFLFPEAHCAP